MGQPYIVSARKYRPSTFKSVVGQKTLTGTLKNAIESGRLAQAYLFCGPRGVGKTSCARIFAKTINCLSPTPDGEACGLCDSCRAIDEGNSFNIVELDAASNNGVDHMRNLTEQVGTPPQSGKYRVFIIDEVHMLSSGAFNAFLKTLEEPPAYVIFILATTEKHKVLPTILSRCQIYDFKRITTEDIADHLEYVADCEGIETEREALSVIARKADGAMRDALSIFDQVASSTRGHVTYERTIENLNVLDYDYYFRLVEAFRAGDVPGALLVYAEIRAKGFDSLYFVNGLATHVRDLMLAADSSTAPLLELSEDVAGRYQEQSRSLPLDWYYAAMKILSDCDVAYRTASEKRLLVELSLIRLCQLLKPPTPPFDRVDRDISLQSLTAQVYIPGVTAARQLPATPEPTPVSVSERPAQTVLPASTTTVRPVVKAPLAGRRTTSIRGAASSANASAPRVDSGPTPATQPGIRRESAQSVGEIPEGYSAVGQELPPTAYTAEQFAEACQEFMLAHSELHIMNSALREHSPEPLGNNMYRLVATQQAQLKEFETNLNTLAGFLRERLGEPSITLRPELTVQQGEREHMQTPREFLSEMSEKNKPMADFIKDLDAEIL